MSNRHQPGFFKGLLVAQHVVFLFLTLCSRAAEHPFVFWNSDDLAQIRRIITSCRWAREEWNRRPATRAEEALHDLLDYKVFGNKEAGLRQKARLLKVVRSRPPLGSAQWINVVIFDMVYDLLSPGERKEIEQVFRRYIDHAIFRNSIFDPEVFNPERNYQRYDAKYYTRTNWLPNIVWPRRVSANLIAASLGNEDLIRRVWGHYGSWQWYFDSYLSDGGFYGEEFSKMGSTPGAMLIYCRAVRNLGLNELGFGYRSRTGCTMQGHLESLIRLGYPRVILYSGRPHYPMVTTGDLRGSGSSRQGKNLPTYAFQHSIVRGFLPGETPKSIQRWQAHGAWGGEMRGRHAQWDGYSGFTPKMQIPLWFEAAHREWPEAGFDYFLAQMRLPGQETYMPSLYFGLSPISPKKTAPPRALSWVAVERGLAMLRAEESPAYWESPKPAVAMRLTAPYAHSVYDSLSLSGFFAFNRPIYLNRQTRRGYAFGYSRSILSHCGVMVDGNEPAFTGSVVVRHGFYKPVKFLAAESMSVYPGCKAQRALMLTETYLFDLFSIRSTDGRPHEAIWTVHALGVPEIPEGQVKKKVAFGGPLHYFKEGLCLLEAAGFTDVTVLQRLALKDPAQAVLPSSWYQQRIGVRIFLHAGEGADIYVAPTPSDDPENRRLKNPSAYSLLKEVGGTSIIAKKHAKEVDFIALHLPFEKGTPPAIQPKFFHTGESDIVAVEVTYRSDPELRDWILVDMRGEFDRRRPFAFQTATGEQFTFAGHAFVRAQRTDVAAWGDLRGLRIRVHSGNVRFSHNGRLTRASVKEEAPGRLTLLYQ